MNPEIEKLIKFSVADGTVTDKEKAVIMQKAAKLGEDIEEVELILNGELALIKNRATNKTQNHHDTINSTSNELANINFINAALLYLNRHKFLKYALMFFLICLGFNLITLLLFL